MSVEGETPELEGIPQREIAEAVRGREQEWVDAVRELARLESPSTDPRRQGPVFDWLVSALGEMGFRTRRFKGRSTGGILLARVRDRSRGRLLPTQLLVGHTDTVWPVGTLSEMPVTIEDGRLRGPGVFDMKAGLVSMIVALRALRELGLDPSVAPVLFINSDEEIGSPESDRYLRWVAARVSRALVLEPALEPVGRLKTARKGYGRFTIRIHGKSAHSGLAPQEGASAIEELASVVQRLHALTDYQRGIVVNVGVVEGGTRSNVVAARAEAQVDLRVATVADGEEIEERVRSLEPLTAGCSLEVVGGMERPPMERNPQNRVLWHAASSLGAAMGLELEEGRSGGGSDGNITNLYTPTLDGLGAVGDGAHALHEYVDIERSLERCALLAGLLMLPETPAYEG